MSEEPGMSPVGDDEINRGDVPSRGATQPKLRVTTATILSMSWTVFAREFASILGIALIVMAPYILITHVAMSWVQADLEEQRAEADEPPDDQSPEQMALDQLQLSMEITGKQSLVGVIGNLFAYILQGAVTWIVIRSLRGRSATVGESISKAFGQLLPAIGVALTIFGLVAVIVLPGVLLAIVAIPIAIIYGIVAVVALMLLTLGLYCAVPALIVERPGVWNAIKRSWFLTKGHKGWIFLTLLVVGMVQGAGLGIVGAMVGGGASGDPVEALSRVWITTAVGVPFMAFGAVCAAVAYYQLRVRKESFDFEQISRVFD